MSRPLGSKNKVSKLISTNCASCGKSVSHYPYRLKRSQKLFCGKLCRQNKKQVECSTCKKIFEVSNYRIKLRSKLYCSIKCHSGLNHPKWKGENVGYQGLHRWIRRQMGQPTKCEHCGTDGLYGKRIHWANKSQQYRREITDWLRLCASCHRLYDTNKLIIQT